MRAFNLLPQQERRRGMPALRSTTSVLVGAGALLATVAVVLGVAFAQSSGKVSDKRDTLVALEHKVSKLEAARAQAVALQSSTRPRVAAFTSAAGARMKWDNLLDDISRVLPAGSWLSSLNMQAATAAPTPAAAPASAPTALTVAGYAFTQDTVALVMERLERVPALSDVTLQSSARTPVGDAKPYQFTMSANVLASEVPQ